MILTDAAITGGAVGRGVGASVGRGVDTTGCGVGAGVGAGVVMTVAVGDGVGLPTVVWLAAGDAWLVAGAPQAVNKHARTIVNGCRAMNSSVENSVGG